MPGTFLRDVTLRLPHADAAAHCSSFPRMENICDNSFWEEKAEIDLGKGHFKIVYQNPYFNYLAARVRYLERQITEFFAELEKFLNSDFSGPDYRYRFYRDPKGSISENLKFKRSLTEDAWDVIDEMIPNKETVDQEAKDILLDHILTHLPVDRVGQLQEEADSLSLILARHLRETQPDNFRLIFLEDQPHYPRKLREFFESDPEENRTPAPDLGYKMATILLFKEGYGREDIFIYRLPHHNSSFFLENPEFQDEYKFLYNRYANTYFIKGQIRVPIHDILPKQFFNFALNLGLNDAAISWLYQIKEKMMTAFQPRD